MDFSFLLAKMSMKDQPIMKRALGLP
jgi:hypothetical protein